MKNLRQLARKTKNNPKGLGIIDMSYGNLRIKVIEGKLIPKITKNTALGSKYHYFDDISVANYKKL